METLRDTTISNHLIELIKLNDNYIIRCFEDNVIIGVNVTKSYTHALEYYLQTINNLLIKISKPFTFDIKIKLLFYPLIFISEIGDRTYYKIGESYYYL
jgi:hypothetical protein